MNHCAARFFLLRPHEEQHRSAPRKTCFSSASQAWPPDHRLSLPDTFWLRSAKRTSIPSHVCETVNTRSAQPDFWLVVAYPSTTSSPAETGFYRVDHGDQNEHAGHDGDTKRPN